MRYVYRPASTTTTKMGRTPKGFSSAKKRSNDAKRKEKRSAQRATATAASNASSRSHKRSHSSSAARGTVSIAARPTDGNGVADGPPVAAAAAAGRKRPHEEVVADDLMGSLLDLNDAYQPEGRTAASASSLRSQAKKRMKDIFFSIGQTDEQRALTLYDFMNDKEVIGHAKAAGYFSSAHVKVAVHMIQQMKKYRTRMLDNGKDSPSLGGSINFYFFNLDSIPGEPLCFRATTNDTVVWMQYVLAADVAVEKKQEGRQTFDRYEVDEDEHDAIVDEIDRRERIDHVEDLILEGIDDGEDSDESSNDEDGNEDDNSSDNEE